MVKGERCQEDCKDGLSAEKPSGKKKGARLPCLFAGAEIFGKGNGSPRKMRHGEKGSPDYNPDGKTRSKAYDVPSSHSLGSFGTGGPATNHWEGGGRLTEKEV